MFDTSDEGKTVVSPDGEPLGTVERVRDGTAYVRPAPGLLAGLGSRIAGNWDGHCRLDERAVRDVDGDRVVLAGDSTDAVDVPREV